MPVSNNNLTESQSKILAAIRREMVDIADGIRAEIEQLRREQKERHQPGEADAELARIRQDVKPRALYLLGIIGLTDEDLAAWKARREGKWR
jgi:hypothetical protein